MKNTDTRTIQMTGTNIALCIGQKAYRKYLKKMHTIDEELDTHGRCLELVHDDGSYAIVIGLCDHDDRLEHIGLMIHEVTHAISFWMEHHGIVCDETRAYTTQMLFLDFCDILAKYHNRKEKKNEK